MAEGKAARQETTGTGWGDLLRHPMAVVVVGAFLAFMGWLAINVADLQANQVGIQGSITNLSGEIREVKANQKRIEESIADLQANQARLEGKIDRLLGE